eukprot:Sdes_comp13551_c0_seq1m3228
MEEDDFVLLRQPMIPKQKKLAGCRSGLKKNLHSTLAAASVSLSGGIGSVLVVGKDKNEEAKAREYCYSLVPYVDSIKDTSKLEAISWREEEGGEKEKIRFRCLPKVALRNLVNQERIDSISTVLEEPEQKLPVFTCNDFMETEPTPVEERPLMPYKSRQNYVKIADRVQMINSLLSLKKTHFCDIDFRDIFPEFKQGKSGFNGFKVLEPIRPNSSSKPSNPGIVWEKTIIESLGTADLAILATYLEGNSKLDLKVMGLESVPKMVLLKNTLTCLNLSFNSFSEFPREILTLELLEVLILRDNPIPSIPDEIWFLKRLKSLCMSFNCLSRVPMNLCYCSMLR